MVAALDSTNTNCPHFQVFFNHKKKKKTVFIGMNCLNKLVLHSIFFLMNGVWCLKYFFYFAAFLEKDDLWKFSHV